MDAKYSRKNGHARSMERSKDSSLKKTMKNTALSFLLMTGLSILATVLIAAAFYTTADPNRFISPAAISVLFASSLLGGFLSAKKNKGSALLCGLIYAGMLLALTFATSLFFDTTLSAEYSIPTSIGLRGIAVALSVLGAFIGIGQKKKKVNKHKR